MLDLFEQCYDFVIKNNQRSLIKGTLGTDKLGRKPSCLY